MNTSSPLDARGLAHRLTAVGHALHHRLVEQLHESHLDPRTVTILGVIAGRIDAPWASDRIARGGERVAALAERGWIERVDDAWLLTDDGRAVLDRVEADRASVIDGLPTDQLAQVTSALDALADSLGMDAAAPRHHRFGPTFGREHDRGFGGRGFGPTFGREDGRGFGGRGRHTDSPDTGREGRQARAAHDGGHRGHRAAQRAFERGFDAGFSRGRETSASI